jgi:DNA helicase-2/ATP-dependent DNA helicase PcrA
VPTFATAYQSSFSHAHYEFRTNPYGRKGKGTRVREERDTYRYEEEDQSVPAVRLGMRVRHPEFGVGTVIAVEEYNDDLKITVRFNVLGVKKLLAKYAKLEPA